MEGASYIYKSDSANLPSITSRKTHKSLSKGKPSASASIANVHISSDDEEEIILSTPKSKKKSSEYTKLISLLEPQIKTPEQQLTPFQSRVNNLCISLYDDLITLKPEFFIDFKEDLRKLVKNYQNKKTPAFNLPQQYLLSDTSSTDINVQLQQQLSNQSIDTIGPQLCLTTDASGQPAFITTATNEAGQQVIQVHNTDPTAIDNSTIRATFTPPTSPAVAANAETTCLFQNDSNPGHEN